MRRPRIALRRHRGRGWLFHVTAASKLLSHANSGLATYDHAKWSGWIPEQSRVHSAGSLGSVLQTAPPGAAGPADVNVTSLNAAVLLFWTKGSGSSPIRCRIDGKHHQLRPRRWQHTVLPAGCPSWWLSTPSDSDGVFHLHLGETFMARLADEERAFSALRGSELGCDPVITSYAIWIFEALGHGPPSRLFWETAATAIGLRLIRSGDPKAAPRGGGLAPWQVKRVTDHLEADVAADTHLTDLASLVNLSAQHFCRAFRVSTGLPPHAYQRRLRCEKAREMLHSTELSIGQIAAAVGYETPQAFARMFRAEVGASPSEYRRQRWS